ncbi:MAG: hypothetical protein ACREYE_23790, partial [Gammaproteobacteria bacterium]
GASFFPSTNDPNLPLDFVPATTSLWICEQSATPIPAFALRAILWTNRGKRCAFPTACPQVGGCPQAP